MRAEFFVGKPEGKRPFGRSGFGKKGV